jgi:hypothetical protein
MQQGLEPILMLNLAGFSAHSLRFALPSSTKPCGGGFFEHQIGLSGPPGKREQL